MITIEDTRNSEVKDIIEQFVLYTGSKNFESDIESEFNDYLKLTSRQAHNESRMYYNFVKNKIDRKLIIGECCFAVDINDKVKLSTIKKRFETVVSKYSKEFIKLSNPKKRLERFLTGDWTGLELTESEIKNFNLLISDSFDVIFPGVHDIKLQKNFKEIALQESIFITEDPFHQFIYDYLMDSDHLTRFESFDDLIKSSKNISIYIPLLTNILENKGLEFLEPLYLNLNDLIYKRYVSNIHYLDDEIFEFIKYLKSKEYTFTPTIILNPSERILERIYTHNIYEILNFEVYYNDPIKVKDIILGKESTGNKILIDKHTYFEDEYSFKQCVFSRKLIIETDNIVYASGEVVDLCVKLSEALTPFYKLDKTDQLLRSQIFELNKFKYLNIVD